MNKKWSASKTDHFVSHAVQNSETTISEMNIDDPKDHSEIFRNSLLLDRFLSASDQNSSQKELHIRSVRKRRKKVRIEDEITGESIYDFVETEEEKNARLEREKLLARMSLRRNALIQYDLRGECDIAGAVHFLVTVTKGQALDHEGNRVILNNDFLNSIETVDSDSSCISESEDGTGSESVSSEDSDSTNAESSLFPSVNLKTGIKRQKYATNEDLLPFQLDGLTAPSDNKLDFPSLLRSHKLDSGPWNHGDNIVDYSKCLDECNMSRDLKGYSNTLHETQSLMKLQVEKILSLDTLADYITISSKEGRTIATRDKLHLTSLKFKSLVSKYFFGPSKNDYFSKVKGRLKKYMDALSCTSITADSMHITLRMSNLLASASDLWHEIYPRLQVLRESSGIITDEEFDWLRYELLSADAQLVTGCNGSEVWLDAYKRIKYFRMTVLSFLKSKEQSLNAARKGEKIRKTRHFRNSTHSADMFSQVIHDASIDVDSLHLIVAVMHIIISKSFVELNTSETFKSLSIKKIIFDIENFLDILIKTGCRSESSDTNPLRKNTVFSSAIHAILCRQSIVASTKLETSKSNVSREKNSKRNYQEVAEKLATESEKYFIDEKMRHFHKIHIPSAIASLCQHLPPYAAKILKSAVFDSSLHEVTPFDLLRMALGKMERKGHIRHGFDNHYNAPKNEIHINELIRSFQESINVLESTLYQDNQDLFECRCWYTALHLGMLCLASGVYIGGDVSAALPPAEDDMFRIPRVNQDRCRHKEYVFIRHKCVQAIEGFLLMDIRSAGQVSGYKFHYAIKEMLEWKQASCLIAMRPYLHSSDAFYKLRCLHAGHCYQVARNDATGRFLPIVLELAVKKLISKKEVISLLLLIVDREPWNTENWYMLSGFIYITENNREIDLNMDCLRTRYAYIWDREGLLLIPQTKNTTKNAKDMKTRYKTIRLELSKMKSFPSNSYDETLFKSIISEANRNMTNIDWLWPQEPCYDDSEDYLDLIDEKCGKFKTFESQVPCLTKDRVRTSVIQGPLRKVSPPTRLILSKIIISWYLNVGKLSFSSSIHNANEVIKSMICECTDSDSHIDQTSPEFISLCILQSLNWRGFKVSDMLEKWEEE